MSEFKRVEVASTNSREFVKAILELGAQGATLPEDSGVFKGIVLRTTVEVAEDVLVEQSPVVRVLPKEKKKTPKLSVEVIPEVNVENTDKVNKEALEEMGLKELRDLTGILGKSKKDIIAEYLSK